jgi:hypothetical protein
VRVEAAVGSERYVDQPDEDGHFDQRADDTGEGLTGGDAEDADRDGDRELEVLPAAVNAMEALRRTGGAGARRSQRCRTT